MIEERHPQLLRGSHRHLVGLEEQIVRQPDAPVELQHPFERRQPLGLRPLLGKPGHQPFADPRRRAADEARFLVVAEGDGDAAVALLERQRRPAQVLSRLRVPHERQRRRSERSGRAELLHPQHGPVDGVAGQHLVGAFAREDHHHLFPRPLRQIVQRHAGGVRDGGG